MRWLKGLRRRWLLWARGECEWDGCTEPAKGFPMYGSLCSRHLNERIQQLYTQAAERKFEREVAVTAEALRRTLPAALSTPQDKEGR